MGSHPHIYAQEREFSNCSTKARSPQSSPAFRCRCCCPRFGTIIAREAEHATEVIVRLAKGRGAKAVVCGTKNRRENLRSRMSKPKRIQRSRAKGWEMPANAIYVGRPTVWGNPYVVGSELMNGETLNAEKAVALYEQHLADNFSERDIRHCLRDKDLACWCALDQPCHADVLLRIANSRPK